MSWIVLAGAAGFFFATIIIDVIIYRLIKAREKDITTMYLSILEMHADYQAEKKESGL